MQTTRPSSWRALGGLLVAWLLAAVVAGLVAVVPGLILGRTALAVTDRWESIRVNLADLATPLAERTLLTDADGTELAVLYNENRLPVASLTDISPTLIDAVLATEDDRFYQHGPIDVQGSVRALARDADAGRVVQGGSTITQQYVKLLRANAGQVDAKTNDVNRKLVELKYAVELEKTSTKDQILLGYLNIAYFGNGAYGIGAAAQAYFSVPPAELTLPQAATIAGLLKNPTGYDPTLDQAAATVRRATVLGRMADVGRITEEARATATAAPLGLNPSMLPNGCVASPYPFYCDWVRNTLLTDPVFGKTSEERATNLARGGFTVVTALDQKAMAAAQASVDAAFTHNQSEVAAIAVVDPGTGAVPAIAASRDYATSQFNIPVQAALQPGSAFKPITLAAAFERGFTTTQRMDAPARYTPAKLNAPAGGFSNIDGRGRYNLDAAGAMKFSVNTWFVRLEEQVGVIPVADMAFRLGMTSMDPATRHVGPSDASLTLGAFETSPLQMASVYATFAADGVECAPTPILKVTATTTGDNLPSLDPACHQVLSPAVARAVTRAMSATAEPGGTAAGLGLTDRPWVGKTGTTNANGATWFAGYTPNLAAAVWVGDVRGPSYNLKGVTAYGHWNAFLYGSTVAGPVWDQAVTGILTGVPPAAFPDPFPVTRWGTQVPDVVGMGVPEAVSALTDAGLDPVLAAGGPTDGVVAAQSPAGGSSVTGSVQLTVNAPFTTVVPASGGHR
jgi:membrane peptidoglycan carboxypeptidase